MRRRFWITWGVLVSVSSGGFLLPFAFDVQLTKRTWIQVASAGGAVRLIVVRGDSTASPLSATVTLRERDTWRSVLRSDFWGGYTHYTGLADSSGTPIDTYRIDLPLLLMLLVVAMPPLMLRTFRRWCPPPHLLWAELASPPRTGRVFRGRLRRVVIVIAVLLAFCAGCVWVGSYGRLKYRWIYTSDQAVSQIARLAEGINRPTGAVDYAEFLDDAKKLKELRDGLARPGLHLGIEVRPRRLAINLYTTSATGAVPVADASFAGFKYRRQPLTAFASLNSGSRFLGGGLAGATQPGTPIICVEHTLAVPFWALTVVFTLWPLLAFFRGTWRRAIRRAAGCCRHCGYNLTGLAEPRCPECGSDFGGSVSTVR